MSKKIDKNANIQMCQRKRLQKLEVWKRAHQLVILIYKYTENFPRKEEYGLTSQLRRAALSIPTNTVEGQASRSKKEFLNFLNMANRSLVEAEYLLEVALELQYLEKISMKNWKNCDMKPEFY